ncbi:TadE/TadG family type IV pilus assembly protein [Sphingobium sp. AP49]|uniref:TadE/TadG family type IV pilus assembly protein n=1 Tax=Sphingobium sp. AP49 TaxID=1144307 RepID=UPI00026EDD27|nr:TadE/TadG family type IV pilus assembly protein [Sphingobium sp. AP49]WHO37114.1 TadE/TadG family type IV pilus assembly protein [Sphingobium sp. AP49]
MRNTLLHWPTRPAPRGTTLLRSERGSVLVEAAFALPLMIALLLGILLYGSWFMTAHTLQQAANEAARAAIAGLNDTERRALVDQSVAISRSSFPLPGAQSIGVTASANSGYYTVTLTYSLTNAPFFAAAPFPLPASQIQRSAIVRIAS